MPEMQLMLMTKAQDLLPVPRENQGLSVQSNSVSPELSSSKLAWLGWCCQGMDEDQAGSSAGCSSRWGGAFL